MIPPPLPPNGTENRKKSHIPEAALETVREIVGGRRSLHDLRFQFKLNKTETLRLYSDAVVCLYPEDMADDEMCSACGRSAEFKKPYHWGAMSHVFQELQAMALKAIAIFPLILLLAIISFTPLGYLLGGLGPKSSLGFREIGFESWHPLCAGCDGRLRWRARFAGVVTFIFGLAAFISLMAAIILFMFCLACVFEWWTYQKSQLASVAWPLVHTTFAAAVCKFLANELSTRVEIPASIRAVAPRPFRASSEFEFRAYEGDE